MRRRLVIILGSVLAVALLALATLPWWLAPVLRVVGRRFRAEFTRYERIGYGRFALHEVNVKQSTTHVRVDRVETATPLLWLVHRWSGHPDAIVTTDWSVDVRARDTPSPPSEPGGARHLRVLLFKIADALDRWVPVVEIGKGTVTWPGAGLQLGPGSWKERTLTVRPLRYGSMAGDVRANFAKNGELNLDVKAADETGWHVALKSTSDDIHGQLQLWEQTASVEARLPEQGWMPASLQLAATQWTLPASRLKLGESYSSVRGDVRLEWREGTFEIAADAAGEVPSGKKAPPLALKLHARGDRASVTIDSLQAEIPGVTARLSAPVVIDRSGRMAEGASHFGLEIDLEKQPWVTEAKGRITGRADVVSRGFGVPHVEGELDAANVALRDWAIGRFAAKAAFDWPRLQIGEATLNFAEGGQLTAKGGWDFRASELIDASVDGEIRPSAIARWLPAGMNFESATVSAKAHGAAAEIQYEGRVHATGLKTGALHPLAADVAWTGRGADVEISEARIVAAASSLTLAGALDAKGARIAALKFSKEKDDLLTLAQPATLSWSPQFALSSLQLTGPEASVTLGLVAGESGQINATARNFPSSWLTDFIDVPGPEWRVGSLDVQGKWDRGPLLFSLRGEVAVAIAPQRSANVLVAAQGNNEGIKVESLRVTEGTTPIVDATGQLPLTIHPGGAAKAIVLEKTAPLSLHATTASNPEFWQKITEATGLEFKDPAVQLELSGTWSEPQGELTAKATRVSADPARIKFSLPTIEALDAHVTVNGSGLEIERLTVRVEGQDVRASGKLPVTLGQWAEFKRAPVAFIRKGGSLRLEIPDAEIAALSRYSGRFLAPAGRLHIDVSLKPGGDMEGTLRLQDATTLPLGPLGVLQEIQADVRLAGRALELKSVSARAGGQPVALSGKVELSVDGVPKYDVTLKGENLPLVRETGLLMRADLDLRLVTQGSNATAVTGAVKLRDSMFLSDVRALIPHGGGGGPSRRPPFFSIDVPPVNAWQLNVDVRGDHFMRLRSTVFVGVASAHFRLGGTLGEPRATGEAIIDNGHVLLPFASFSVDQGTVRLTESDPYSLRIFLVGRSRRYGYDLRMEITGTAADPVVAFSSSPPLDSKQVLLMVTAGEVPNDEVAYGGTQRMARLGAYLGQSLINNFGGNAADADRLTISTGERVSRQGRETYDVEYRLNDRYSVVGEYDEFDEYNAGVKWRVFAPKKNELPRAASTPAEKKEAGDGPAR